MSKIIQGNLKILSNKKVGPDYYKMELRSPRIARLARPGQFVHLRCNDGIEPLLRRPFSFHRLNQHSFELVYEVVGRGTKLLARKRKGDTADVLGPLGNGFDLQGNTDGIRNTILIAGGMGIAPLLALAEALAKGKRKSNLLILLGARNRKRLISEKDFKRLGLKVQLATDDGSRGHKGPVTKLLKKVLRTTNHEPRTTIYACGPQPMLEEVARISKNLKVSAYASLEENMACGVGACLGCMVKTKAGYKRVCKDGPVFNLREIKW